MRTLRSRRLPSGLDTRRPDGTPPAEQLFEVRSDVVLLSNDLTMPVERTAELAKLADRWRSQGKGHAVEALYTVLAGAEYFDRNLLHTYLKFGSDFVGHATRNIPGAASVLSVPMVRPLDTDALFEVAGRVRALIVMEEHSVHGGLGEACSSALMTEGISDKFRHLGIPDEPIVNGWQLEVLAHYGMSANGITSLARELLK